MSRRLYDLQLWGHLFEFLIFLLKFLDLCQHFVLSHLHFFFSFLDFIPKLIDHLLLHFHLLLDLC